MSNYFHVVPELIGIQSISLSGVYNHCLVVAADGRVFGRGTNRGNQLGIDEESTKKFVESKNIKSVLAGNFHSFFVDNSGALYA